MTETPLNTPHEAVRTRLDDVTTWPLRPDTLVGSYFHSDGSRRWQGCVVAEPHPGMYLVELLPWPEESAIAQLVTETAPYTQRVVSVGELADWRFYDDAQRMQDAYDNTEGGIWGDETPPEPEPEPEP